MLPISVLMSVYNEPLEWIRASIESIIHQTFQDFEFIIVNDNPHRSEVKDQLKRYALFDNRVQIIENDRNMGLTKSLNKAIKAAQGLYIARMDADDISLPERLELQYEFLEKHKDIFLVGSSVWIIDRNGVPKEKVIKHTSHTHILHDMFSGALPFYHPTIMFRNKGFLYRECFEVAQDYDFYLNLLSRGKKFSNLKQILLRYRMSDESVSMNRRREQIILKKLALQLYHQRATIGKDSYHDLDFNNQEQLMRFLRIKPQKFKATVLKEQTIFALGGSSYSAARKTFNLYAKYTSMGIETIVLWFFVNIPFVYRLYRKLKCKIAQL
ncbi:MAG: glycosyltransferase [Candidatus Hodarchaeota archaeon]